MTTTGVVSNVVTGEAEVFLSLEQLTAERGRLEQISCRRRWYSHSPPAG